MLSASSLALRQLPIASDAGLPQRFSFALGSARYDIVLYAQIELGAVNTTAQAEWVVGNVTVRPESMAGIQVGTRLIVDSGQNQEDVVVAVVTTTSFTALFKNSHRTGTLPIRSAVNRLDPPETVYDLAPLEPTAQPLPPPGYLVLRVARAGAPAQPLLLGKVVVDPALVQEASEIGLVVRRARVARGNLNGSGHFGTDIVIGVGRLWA